MNNIVGTNLKLLREANKFSQEQVAKYLGINRSTYSNYELGDREAPLEILEMSCNLYGCSLHNIFEDNKESIDNMLLCAFRVDNLSESDIHEIAAFKEIVKNYLKLKELSK